MIFTWRRTGASNEDLGKSRKRQRRPRGVRRARRPLSRTARRLHLRTEATIPRKIGPHHRLVVTEYNPRATSGVHLWSQSPHLANVIVSNIPTHPASSAEEGPNGPNENPQSAAAGELGSRPGSKRQVGPGMLMSEHKDASFRRFLNHLGHLVGTRDVIFSWKALPPVLTQPLLLMNYYEVCHEQGGQSPAGNVSYLTLLALHLTSPLYSFQFRFVIILVIHVFLLFLSEISALGLASKAMRSGSRKIKD